MNDDDKRTGNLVRFFETFPEIPRRIFGEKIYYSRGIILESFFFNSCCK